MNSYPSEVAWTLERFDGAGWAVVLGWDGETEVTSINQFDISETEVNTGTETRTFTGSLEAGQYRLVIVDTYGDGWQVGASNYPGRAIMTVANVTQELLIFGAVDWNSWP